jgi:hypothetical protein
MTYPYGTRGAPVVGNGLGGLPQRNATTTVSAVIDNHDLYSRKKVRLVKVGSQVSLGSVSTILTNMGLPTPMGFGRFTISRTSGTCAVVDYGQTGILQVRSNSNNISGRSSSNAVFRGVGAAYWYNNGSLYRVLASGASGSSQALLVNVGTAAASGTLYDGRSWTSFSAPSLSNSVAKWGNYAVFVGTATVSAQTETIAVLVSLLDGTVATAMSLGVMPTRDQTACTVYKNMLTVFGINNTTLAITSRQLNFADGSVNTLTDSVFASGSISGNSDNEVYAADGAVWLNAQDTISGGRFVSTYGFATDSNGLAVNHGSISTTFNQETFARSTSTSQALPSFYEVAGYRDFDFNLVYGTGNSDAFETINTTTMYQTVLLGDNYRSRGAGRARAPIAFLESSLRLPVAVSLVVAGPGDQPTADSTTKGYDTALVYLDNGYWILMATEGDGTVPSYLGYLQLYREV